MSKRERKRRLKVYGGGVIRHGRSRRAVIAARNAQEVADALGNASAYYVRGYWSITGNAREVELATASPGILFVQTEDHSSSAYEAEPRTALSAAEGRGK